MRCSICLAVREAGRVGDADRGVDTGVDLTLDRGLVCRLDRGLVCRLDRGLWTALGLFFDFMQGAKVFLAD
jgi:hypothetical protein